MSQVKLNSVPYSAKIGKRVPRSENKNLLKLHAFFRKIVDAAGKNAPEILLKITKRLTMTQKNRPAVKVSKIMSELNGSDKVAVVVSKVLDDERLMVLPAMKIVALKWSRSVQQKIEACGGSISTLDQFIKVGGSLENLVLVHGDPNARKASKFFGPAPGEKGSKTYPRILSKCKNAEKRLNIKKPVSYEDSDSE
ncbi:large subunit ribosomal protein L18e [Enteropsectra breve]|nr:large subunit ribosomal protein L18e [Enteropsectra breve]